MCLGCALLTAISSRASAGASLFDELGQRNWSGSGGPPPPPGDGDPDIPMSSLKRALPSAGARPSASSATSHVAGDGVRVESVMMWHFRVVMQSLRLWGIGRF
jgi:hypothetical protein